VIEVRKPKELKMSGACLVSETETGVGGTSSWRISGTYPNSTLAVFFDVFSQQAQGNTRGYVQFINTYQHANGN